MLGEYIVRFEALKTFVEDVQATIDQGGDYKLRIHALTHDRKYSEYSHPRLKEDDLGFHFLDLAMFTAMGTQFFVQATVIVKKKEEKASPPCRHEPGIPDAYGLHWCILCDQRLG